MLVDEVDGAALAVPLFSSWATGNEKLDDGLKSGLTVGWIGPHLTHHFSRWQHWWIPVEDFPHASEADFGSSSDRHNYAVDQPEVLERIADWRLRNRNAFRGA